MWLEEAEGEGEGAKMRAGKGWGRPYRALWRGLGFSPPVTWEAWRVVDRGETRLSCSQAPSVLCGENS